MLMGRAVAENGDDRDHFGRAGEEDEVGTFAIDFHDIWAAVYRSRAWVLGITLTCFALGVVLTLLTTPFYRATATIQIDQEAAKVLGTEQSDVSSSILDTERFLQTQMDIIRSRSVAISVAEELRLFEDVGFLESMDVDPDSASYTNLTPEEARRQLVLETMAENLTLDLPTDSRLARVSFDSPDARLAARIANSFSENFIRNNLQRKFDTSAYAREFLAEQLKQAQVRLERSERAAVAFASRTRIIDTSNAADTAGGQPTPRSLITATLVQLNQDYSGAMSKRISAERQWQRARSTNVMVLPEVLTNLAIQQLLQQRSEAQALYEAEIQYRKQDYPTVRQAAAKVAEINRQISGIAANIRNSIKAQYDVAQAQERAIKNQVDRLKGETLNEQNQGIQLSILRREADTNRQQYAALLTRYNQLNAESGVQANNIALVDRATTPSSPNWPKVPLNLAVALVAGIALSSLFVLAREKIFGTIRTPEDVNQRIHLPLLGSTPDVGKEEILAQLQDPKTEVAEAFNSIRTALALSSKAGMPKTLAFVSTQASEGKSTACYATATGLGKLGRKIVVLDLDLRRPNQHKLFGLNNKVGMSDVLAGNAKLDDAIHITDCPNVSLIAGGPIPPNPTELLTSESLPGLLQELLGRFDIVLVDSAPVLGLADAVIIGSLVEAVAFVVESGRNNARSLLSALGRLRQGDAKIAGIVLSRFDPDQAGYSHSYNYAYSYEYRH